jgi:hypothetical protein
MQPAECAFVLTRADVLCAQWLAVAVVSIVTAAAVVTGLRAYLGRD